MAEEAASYTEEQLNEKKVVELKALCKEKGLKSGGKKSDLITRLLDPENEEHKKKKAKPKKAKKPKKKSGAANDDKSGDAKAAKKKKKKPKKKANAANDD
eukprot:CAMPEP_0201583214 /NCGR_PEP_ID=MMETSP0190_2-20130828/95839_1 /ASSEMBLY_ACC=CAM_ASM_000263 /TAXON_ID=37353 /ORGANISM="Rosalina sp." /LENGTH=99 /DNA_ID=CAMNT_0048024687 /DNA_START=139 /DNA_END=435 /DNA_ORIENTATION=+